MKFWDASAIVPLLMTEPTTKAVQTLAEKDPTMLVWWAAELECASAIVRLERDAALDDAAVTQAFHRLRQLAHTWHEVDPSDSIREAAVRILRVHHLGRRMRFSSRGLHRRRTATLINGDRDARRTRHKRRRIASRSHCCKAAAIRARRPIGSTTKTADVAHSFRGGPTFTMP
jgi:predicted nucleic acid-binding protein